MLTENEIKKQEFKFGNKAIFNQITGAKDEN